MLVARELVLVDHAPGPGGLAGAHRAGRLQDLPVCEVVAVAFEVGGQVVGRLGDPGPDDEGEPHVLQRVQVGRGQHPRVGDHDQVADAVAFGERVQHGDKGLGLGLVALEQVDLQGEARRVDEQPDLDLGVHAVLLAHPDPPELVFLLSLASAAS